MSKLSKEVLLEQIDTWVSSCKHEGIKIHGSCKKCICGEICKQATQQIKEIVKLHFSDDWQQVKKELGKFMQKQKPGVTEEWINAKAFLLQGAANNFVALRQSLTKMLREAGVEVVKK